MKGGSLASDNVLKNIDIKAFQNLNKQMTNAFNGCGGSKVKNPKRIGRIISKEKEGNVAIMNCKVDKRKKGGSLLTYSPMTTGPVRDSSSVLRSGNNDKFLSQEPITTLPVLPKYTKYGKPVDGEMSFSYNSDSIKYATGGAKKKKVKVGHSIRPSSKVSGKVIGKRIDIICSTVGSKSSSKKNSSTKKPKKGIVCIEIKSNIVVKPKKSPIKK